MESVAAYLRSQGLLVGSIAPDHLVIDASGSVSSVEKAFGVQLNDYTIGGQTVHATVNNPSVPAALASTITSIGGLNNLPQGHVQPSKVAQGQPPVAPAQTPKQALPNVGGPGYGGYTPTDLRTAYDITPLVNTANGTGQTVAIYELAGYSTSDVNTYLSYYGLGAAKYSNVLVDGASAAASPGAIEVELDMEVVSAIAPGANQIIYIAPNTGAGYVDNFSAIVNQNTAKVVSVSWGSCEYGSSSSEMNAVHSTFQQGAAQGQAIFVASGDSGAYGCARYGSAYANILSVGTPANDPYVVGVGGTTLNVNGDSTYSSEAAWSNTTYAEGSGGGVSQYWLQPSYQSGPGVTNGYSTGGREVPDVSADADPNTGYSIYCTATADCQYSNGTGVGWFPIGGTSAAAPLWAGIAADTDQYLSAASAPTLGSASADLYQVFNTTQPYTAYHDITTGNNLYYPATSGYDDATGIGTPDAWDIARDLIPRPGVAAVSPGGFALTSAPGSSPASQVVILSNSGSGAYTWSASLAGTTKWCIRQMPGIR